MNKAFDVILFKYEFVLTCLEVYCNIITAKRTSVRTAEVLLYEAR